MKPYRAFAVNFRAFCRESRMALVPAQVKHKHDIQSTFASVTKGGRAAAPGNVYA